MDHNDFVKCLRQTSKGQIQYERMLNEKTLDVCDNFFFLSLSFYYNIQFIILQHT